MPQGKKDKVIQTNSVSVGSDTSYLKLDKSTNTRDDKINEHQNNEYLKSPEPKSKVLETQVPLIKFNTSRLKFLKSDGKKKLFELLNNSISHRSKSKFTSKLNES